MVRYDIDKNGSLMLVQEIVEPMVYLDHWALRKISEDPTLRARFVDSMSTSGGTLAVSWLNIAEFSQVSSPETHALAESLVEAVLPALFFLESNPVTVWTNEDLQLQRKYPMPAHADVELLKTVASLKPTGLNLFSVRGLFSHVRESSVPGTLLDLTQSMIGHVENLRQQYVRDAVMRRSAKRVPPSTPHPKGTRQLFRELITTLLVDQNMPVDL